MEQSCTKAQFSTRSSDSEHRVYLTMEQSCTKAEDSTKSSDLELSSAKAEPSSFGSKWHHSDLVLLIEGREFHVHKCILSMNSLVFESMFNSDFKEKSAAEIPLPGKSAKEFEVLLKLLYSDEKRSLIDYDNFEFLLELADEYQMDKIKKLCVDFMKSTLNGKNCLYFCQVAGHFVHEEDEVIKKCVGQAKWLPLSAIEGNTHFDQIVVSLPTLSMQILLEKIKVLEKYKKVLDKYYSTCRELVTSIYYSAAGALAMGEMHSVDRENIEFYGRKTKMPNHIIKNHWECYTNNHAPKATRDKFVFDCASCISKLENDWPKSILYKEVESNIKKLRSLARQCENINI